MERVMKGLTMVWAAMFGGGLVAGGWIGEACGIGCGVIGLAFAAELVMDWRRDRNARRWIRRNWGELVMLVPVFRGVRMLALVRRSRRVMRAVGVCDGLVEGADLGQRVKGMVSGKGAERN